jgi:hypothetical protein
MIALDRVSEHRAADGSYAPMPWDPRFTVAGPGRLGIA